MPIADCQVSSEPDADPARPSAQVVGKLALTKMAKVTLDVVVPNAEGLHARPAMQFVDVANRFAATVTVFKDGETVDGKSVMGMITLGATQGTPLKIEADGEDADAACAALKKLFDEKFGED